MQQAHSFRVGFGLLCLLLACLSFHATNAAEGGDLDLSFDPGSYYGSWTDGNEVGNGVRAVVVQPDGKVLIGGGFSIVNGAPRGGVARLNSDGTLDTAFLNGMGGASPQGWAGAVRSVALQPDGKILIGGLFTGVNGALRGHLARLNPNGSLDATFLNGLSGADGEVHSIALQPDGKVVIAGSFCNVNGTARSAIARLNADGSLDTSFVTTLSGCGAAVHAVVLQADGKVLYGGARLNADGSSDATYAPPANTMFEVFALAVQPDGKVLIGGSGTTPFPIGIRRLKQDGSIDASFAFNEVNTQVYSIALQPDGRVLIAGYQRFARVNADGTLDASFAGQHFGSSWDYVYAVAVQPDQKVLLGEDSVTFTASCART